MKFLGSINILISLWSAVTRSAIPHFTLRTHNAIEIAVNVAPGFDYTANNINNPSVFAMMGWWDRKKDSTRKKPGYFLWIKIFWLTPSPSEIHRIEGFIRASSIHTYKALAPNRSRKKICKLSFNSTKKATKKGINFQVVRIKKLPPQTNIRWPAREKKARGIRCIVHLYVIMFGYF